MERHAGRISKGINEVYQYIRGCGPRARFVRRPPADNDLLIYSCLLILSVHGGGSPECTFNPNLTESGDFWEDFTLRKG